jgi:iron complex outermembrane receptor protein
VYGANALLGVVNIITKRGRDIKGLKLAGEVGSLDTSRTRATYGKQWDNGAELLVQGSQFYSHGNERLFFPEFKDSNGGIAQDVDNERNSRAFGKFSYGDMTLRGGYVDRFKRVPTAPYDSIFNDKNNFLVDSQGYVDLDYLTEIKPRLGLELRAFHHWYDYYSFSPYETENEDGSISRIESEEVSDARWWGGEIKLTGTQFAHHKWIAGIELQHDQRQFFSSYTVTLPHQSFYSGDFQGWRTGFYVQDEYRITDHLLINAGLRLDQHHLIKEPQINPRIGLIWDIAPELTAKLLYGSAFRAPNVLEHNLSDPSAKQPQEELVKSYEAVTEWYPGGGLKLLGTLFYNDMSKILLTDPNTDNAVNSGKFTTLGFELGGEKLWDNGRQLKLTWTHNYTRENSFKNNGWAIDSPRNLVKAHYAEPLLHNKLRLGFEEIFVDERLTTGKNIAPGYHLLNINLALAKPFYGIEASLGVYNVLDQRFRVVTNPNFAQDTLAMDGRTVRFRMEYSF